MALNLAVDIEDTTFNEDIEQIKLVHEFAS